MYMYVGKYQEPAISFAYVHSINKHGPERIWSIILQSREIRIERKANKIYCMLQMQPTVARTPTNFQSCNPGIELTMSSVSSHLLDKTRTV